MTTVDMTIIQLKKGTVKGKVEDGLYTFTGIPYGKANRFEAPKLYEIEGEFDATSLGKKACQVPYKPELMSEDCLNLNIYTPCLNKNLPVLVEVHGGAFQTGSNQSVHPKQVIGDKEFIYVSINYRLGVFGYLYQEDYPTSGNNGTLDQLCALQWVQDNIAYFGGDKTKVTLLGSSAGAKSIGALMATKDAKSLFNQVILISGAYQSVRSIQTAKVVSKDYFDIIKTTSLEDKTVEELLEAQKVLCSGSGSTCLFGPVSDGIVISKDYYKEVYTDSYWSGNAIVGSSAHEMAFFKLFDKNFIENAPSICEGLFGKNAPYAIKAYNELKDSMTSEDAWIKVISDYMYRTYSYRLAKILSNNGSNVYLYSVEFEPALHCMDHILAFETLGKMDKLYQNPQDALDLGKTIIEAYTSFIISGQPSIEMWQPLNKENSQLIFDTHLHTVPVDGHEALDEIEDSVYIR